MAADVVADDTDFAAFGLAGDDDAQEGHELLAGVAHCRFGQHLARGGVKCR